MAANSLTRRDIRRAVIRNTLGPARKYLLEPPSITTAHELTYGQLAGLLDSDQFRGGQAYALVGTGEARYISEYNPLTGVVTLNTDFSGDPPEATVEVIDNRSTFAQIHECIDRAIAELNQTVYDDGLDETLMTEDDRYEYPLPPGFAFLRRVAIDAGTFANDRYTSHTDQEATALTLSASTQRLAQPLQPFTEVRLKKLWVLARIASGSPTGSLRVTLRADSSASPGSVTVSGVNYPLTNLETSHRWHGLALPVPVTMDPTTRVWWDLDPSGVTFAGGSIEVLGSGMAAFPLGVAKSSADGGGSWANIAPAVSLCFVAQDERYRPEVLQRYTGKPGREGVWRVSNDSAAVLQFMRALPGGLPLQLTGQVIQQPLVSDADIPVIDGGLVIDYATAILMEELSQGDLRIARLAKEKRVAAEGRALRLGAAGRGARVESN